MRGTVEQRLWAKVDFTGDCWLWTAGCNNQGYGQIKVAGKVEKAHRVAWELLVGPISTGREMDHLCRVKRCVNPDHLEPVTHQVNDRRGIAGAVNGVRERSKTHCPYGHEYSPENTWVDRHGWRYCRACFQRRDCERAERLRHAVA